MKLFAFTFTLALSINSFANSQSASRSFASKLVKSTEAVEAIKARRESKGHMYACLPYKIAFYSMKACQEFRHQGGEGKKKELRDCQCKKM